MANVVILGGGFAGVAATLRLLRHKDQNISVTLISENEFHLFTPSLYEVATMEEPRRNIALPYREIFGRNVRVLKSGIRAVHYAEKTVVLTDGKKVPFDYCIASLGSEQAYFHIPGLSEHSLVLKTLSDAVHMKKTIEDGFKKAAENKTQFQVLIGGGGFTGTELAGELVECRKHLVKIYHAEDVPFSISVIQGSLLPLKDLDDEVGNIAASRLSREGVTFITNQHIKVVKAGSLTTDKGKTYPFDILVWTGGVKANHILRDSGFPVNPKRQVLVNEYLEIKDHPGMFAAGDCAAFAIGTTGNFAPGVAQVAEEEGAVAGENVWRSIHNKSFAPYRFRHFGYVVPMTGRFAVAELGFIRLTGVFGWMLQQLVLLWYLLHILPFWKAFRRWDRFEVNLKQE